jgi:hypothetical protein
MRENAKFLLIREVNGSAALKDGKVSQSIEDEVGIVGQIERWKHNLGNGHVLALR